jgi:uncharacterized membrane protein
VKSSTSAWLDVGIVASAFAMTAMAYPSLPAVIPTHWNAAGVADGFMPKTVGAWLVPGVSAGTLALFLVLPLVSPRGFEMTGFSGAFAVMRRSVLVFLTFIHGVALLIGLGRDIDMTKAAWGGTGLLLAIIGNYFSKVRKNFFVGIRTPWTLANDEVWERTHRFGGRLWVPGGLLICLAGLAGQSAWLLPALLVMALVPCVYSYLIYRRVIQRDG